MVCNNGITEEFPGAWGYQPELAECEAAAARRPGEQG